MRSVRKKRLSGESDSQFVGTVWRRLMLPIGSAVVAAALAGWVAGTMRPVVSTPLTRFSPPLPAGARFLPVESTRHVVAVSPDLAHATNADLRGDFVRAESGAGAQLRAV